MKTGIIDTGGGMRGVYAAGALDYCLDRGLRFDLAIGISAGSANLSSFCAGQRGRNYRFYTEYSFRKEYMGTHLMLEIGSYINMGYLYGTLSNSDGEDPLDYAALRDAPMDYYVVAMDAQSGETKYFDKRDMSQDNYDILKASSSIPRLCKPYPVQGRLYYDGALADPVPVAKAFELGCERVVLLLNEPADVPREPKTDVKLAKRIEKEYPAAAKRLLERAARFNDGVALARRYASEGRALIVSPDDGCGVDTLTRDKDALNRLYEKGLRDGSKIEKFLRRN